MKMSSLHSASVVSLLVLLTMMSACRTPSDGAGPPDVTDTPRARSTRPSQAALEAETARGYVILRDGASLFATAEDAAAAKRDDIEPRPRGAGGLTPGVVFQVVEDQGEVVALRTIGSFARSEHCARQGDGWDSVNVVAWAPKHMLSAVLTSVSTAEFEDKTAYSLSLGAPVSAGEFDGEWVASVDGVALTLDAERVKVGLSFESASVFVDASQPNRMLPGDVPLWLDGVPFARAGALSPELRALRQHRHLDGDPSLSMVALSSNCVRMSVITRSSYITRAVRARPRLSRRPKSTSPGKPIAVIERGVKLRWPDGREAGEVTRRLSLYEPPSRRGDLVCFVPPLALDSLLCVDDLRQIKRLL